MDRGSQNNNLEMDRPRAPCQEINPLLVDHLLAIVCENPDLSDSDLRSMRSVCRVWNREATKALEKKASATFGRQKYRKNMERMTTAIILLEAENGSFPIPYEIELDCRCQGTFCVGSANAARLKYTLGRFMANVSPRVGVLRVNLPHTNCDVQLQEALGDPRIQLFPRLKVLEISKQLKRRNGDWYNEPALDALLQIGIGCRLYKLSPFLESLSICWSALDQKVTVADALPEDDLLRSLPATLKTLNVSKTYSRTTYELLGSAHLPKLTALTLKPVPNDFFSTEGFFGIFGGGRASALTSLDVTIIGCGINGCTLKFPVFSNLKTLTLEVKDNVELAGPYAQDFSATFPVVTKVTIIGSLSETMMMLWFTETSRAPEVREFSCFLDDADTEDLLRILDVFTSIKVFTFRFADVFQIRDISLLIPHLSGLEELTIGFSFGRCRGRSIDPYLTGLAPKACSDPGLKNWSAFEIQRRKRRLGLSDLNRLKRLTLAGLSSTDEIFISDATAYLAILRMPNLLHLTTARSKMSMTCVADLKARFGDFDPASA